MNRITSLRVRPGIRTCHLMGIKATIKVGMAKNKEKRKVRLHFRVVRL